MLLTFFTFFPTIIFLIILPIQSSYLAKNDHYRIQSLQGFRSTKSVKNSKNWQQAQLAVKRSSLVLGLLQLILTLVLLFLLHFNNVLVLWLILLSLTLLLIFQFFYVNHKLN
ncbi:SdpI family protein [Enterococcus sp. ALS3]|uniref:SdpI family protein n=1 Tax=Enterococcus alishanensis TaxID=1303817 RepID=A0ABS6TCM6_9ENTE|nr:SdpI family protein [Enterococcus alishanensis]MBV7390632.1 SdpI family protein [Enterococcus alishanensis]